jgi:hypothetical protein
MIGRPHSRKHGRGQVGNLPHWAQIAPCGRGSVGVQTGDIGRFSLLDMARLLFAEGYHGVDSGGSAGGDVAGGYRY